MFFTPGQLRGSVGLSKEAFRHWKRVLPAFANGRGHAPSFSSGDVLASAVLRQLTDAAGVRIGHLSHISPAIFEVCNTSNWEVLQHLSLVINVHEGTCVAENRSILPTGNLVLVCALSPLIKALRSEMLNCATPLTKTAVNPRSSDKRVQIRRQR